MGTKPAAELVDSFDGLGVGFEGPHGMPRLGNPSDNSLAVGPDHIVQTVNTRMAIFTKKGKKYDTTGKVLYGGGAEQHGVRRVHRHLRSDEQRRHGRAVRPARGSLADRDADLPSCRAASRSAADVERRATPCGRRRRAWPDSRARPRRCSCHRPRRRRNPRPPLVQVRRRRRAAQVQAQAAVARPPQVSHQLRRNHRRRRVRTRCATP